VSSQGQTLNASVLGDKRPAASFFDGYPLGNGVLGAMLLGSCPEERIGLNHEWLWRAAHRFRDVEPAHQHLAEIRRLFFEGKVYEAGALANEVLGGVGGILGRPNRVDPHQPAGDLLVQTGHRTVANYRRELDLASAVATVRYEFSGTEQRRQCFVHAGRKLVCLRLSASRDNAVSGTFRLTRIQDPECEIVTTANHEALRMQGRFAEGSRFAVVASVYPWGAQASVESDGTAVHVRRADEILVLVTIAVAHDGEDVDALADRQLGDVPADWTALWAEHRVRFGGFYDRVALDLGPDNDARPAVERRDGLLRGEPDNGLMALCFNYGRYLFLSSSLQAELPVHIQGRWNEELHPPWECDFHHNVNLQMYYWPAEICGVPELITPLFDHIDRFVPHGRKAARDLYGCRGVCFPLQTDPWGRATPESRGWDVWTGAAAWLAQHFWWRYEWGGDEQFLRTRAYPFFKEVAAFYEDYLVPDPRDPERHLVPVPSQSPENTFVGGTEPVSLCVGATLDFELIRDVLGHAIRASEILGVDESKRRDWGKILRRLPPLQIGGHGQIQEWLEDYEEAEPGHRHFSHLFPLFPGDRVTAEQEPELARAAKVSLDRRFAAGCGDVGFSVGWAICCFARLQEPDLCHRYLCHLISHFTLDSLLMKINLWPPDMFSIDGNIGVTAAITEMLLQSHRGAIRLLPALPREWPEGAVRGLVARGGYVVDLQWEEGRLRHAAVTSTRGGACRVRLVQGQECPRVTCEGEPLAISREPPGDLVFATKPGGRYDLAWE